MTEAKTPPGEAWPPLPFAETTAWSDSHVGRAAAMRAALSCEPLPAGVPFTGHPFCGADAFADVPSEHRGCVLAAGHVGPCRFTRRLP